MLGGDYNWEKMQSLDAFFLTSPQEIVEISQKFVAVDVEDFLPFVRNRTSNSDVHRSNNSRWNGVLNKIVEPWGFTTCVLEMILQPEFGKCNPYLPTLYPARPYIFYCFIGSNTPFRPMICFTGRQEKIKKLSHCEHPVVFVLFVFCWVGIL